MLVSLGNKSVISKSKTVMCLAVVNLGANFGLQT